MKKNLINVLLFLLITVTSLSTYAVSVLNAKEVCNDSTKPFNFEYSYDPDFVIKFSSYPSNPDFVFKIVNSRLEANLIIEDYSGLLSVSFERDFRLEEENRLGEGLTDKDLEVFVCKSREGRKIKFSNYAFDPQVDFNIKISNYDMDYDFTVFHDSKIFSLEEGIAISVLPVFSILDKSNLGLD